MTTGPFEQRNTYNGSPPRPWIRLRFAAADGSTHECELLADTGNPCAVVIGMALMLKLIRRSAPDVQSNFGVPQGGWIHLRMPELGLDQEVRSFASDAVASAAKKSSPAFEGLAGLPLLRLLEYGGDADCFWVRSALAHP